MQPRQLGTIALAAFVAFAAAFGIGKATSSSNAAGGPSANGAVKALEIADAPAVGAVTTAKVPAFKAKAKKKAAPKKSAPKPSSGTAAPARTAAPVRTVAPVRTAAPVVTAKPAPKQTTPKTGGGGGVSGGGED